jgi:hypothetical protein
MCKLTVERAIRLLKSDQALRKQQHRTPFVIVEVPAHNQLSRDIRPHDHWDRLVLLWRNGKTDVQIRHVLLWMNGKSGIQIRIVLLWRNGKTGIQIRIVLLWRNGKTGIRIRHVLLWRNGKTDVQIRLVLLWIMEDRLQIRLVKFTSQNTTMYAGG